MTRASSGDFDAWLARYGTGTDIFSTVLVLALRQVRTTGATIQQPRGRRRARCTSGSAATTTSTRRASPHFSARSSTIRRRSFSRGASARARSARDSRCHAEPGRDILEHAAPRGGPSQQHAGQHGTDVRDPAHRHAVCPRSSRSRRCCRWSPTASGRSSRCSAARASRSSPATCNVATRAAEEIRRYIVGNAEILKALAADLQDTGLAAVAAGSHPQELRPRSSANSASSRCSTNRAASSPPAASARRASPSRRRCRRSSTASPCRRFASTTTCCRRRRLRFI